MSRFGNFLQGMAQDIPGNRWASTSRLGDVLTGGLARAVNRNEWHLPGFGSDQTSIDDLAAVGTGNSSLYRSIARGAGAGFGAWGAGTLLGGGSSSGEGGGLLGADNTVTSPNYSGWLQNLMRGRSILNRVNGGGGGGAAAGGIGGLMAAGGGAPADNSMIAPTVAPPEQASAETIPPGLLAMLIAQAQAGHADSGDNYDHPLISGGIA